MGQLIHLEEKTEQEKSEQHSSPLPSSSARHQLCPEIRTIILCHAKSAISRKTDFAPFKYIQVLFKVAPTSSSPPQKVMRLYP